MAADTGGQTERKAADAAEETRRKGDNMAANYLETDTGTLRQDIQRIRERIGEAESQLGLLYASMQTLNGMWQGTANAAFDQQFTLDCETMEDMLYDMRNYLSSMENAAGEYERCEEAVREAVEAV